MEQVSKMNVKKFQTTIKKLIWMGIEMWLNITFAISILSRYISNPSLEHFQALKKLHKYLLGIRLILKYTGILRAYIVSGMLLGGDIYLNAYNNSDWGRNKDNCHSTTNYFFEIADEAIF